MFLLKKKVYGESHCFTTFFSVKNWELIHYQIFVIQPSSSSSRKNESTECFSMVLIPQCLCKTKPNHGEIIHPGRSKKSWLEMTMKVVVFFCNFDAIGAMVLLISF